MMMDQQKMQQPPYIGSKISLISKLDIRYQGTLYTVDPIDSTITLAKVQSYGTEDRSTAVFVHPKNDVYDFIIFKASDIKDLIVCEQPKASSLQNIVGANLPYDPAIVSISKIPPPEPKLPPKLNMMNTAAAGATLGGMKRTPGKSGGRGDKAVETRHSIEQLLNGPMRFNYRYPNFQPQTQYQRAKHNSMSCIQDGPQVPMDKDYDFEKANEQFQEKIVEDDMKGKENQDQSLNSEQQGKTNEQVKEQIDVADAITKTATESDDANNEKQNPSALDEFYNKNHSFFDNISCDSLEKESGNNVRPDWKRERQTNQETFGHSAVRSLFYHQRRAGIMRGFTHNGSGANAGKMIMQMPMHFGNGTNYNSRFPTNYYQMKHQ